MIQSFGIFNGNNFLESFLSRVFQLSSNLSYVAAPGTARHCYVETVTQPAHNKLSTACPKFAPCLLYGTLYILFISMAASSILNIEL